MKQQEYIGIGSINRLCSILSTFSAKRIFLVTGKKSFASSGAESFFNKHLGDYEVYRFCDFSSNPKVEDVKKGIELFCQVQLDIVIAVGGGSVIDIAKLVNFFAANGLEPVEYLHSAKTNIKKPKPLIAIPTTAGSGSEATSFAVLYIDKEKFSIDNEFIQPDVAIVDPALTMSLPKYVTAITGMDALSQAIESYWSINSNDGSKKYAKDAIELIKDNLVIAVNEASSSARLAMATAANLAGKAINITRTTAPHAISYPLTSYFGIPHGQAVGVTLSSLLIFNANVTEGDVLDKRGAGYVKETIGEICRLLNADGVAEAGRNIDSLIMQTGLQSRLSNLGLRTKKDIEIIVANGYAPDRVKNNPRILTQQVLREILEQIY